MTAPPSASAAVELQVTVRRLQGSLGFGVDKNNVVVAMKPDGAASRDGLLQKGDQVVGVDGKLLGGRNMSQEVNADEQVYLLTVVRRDAGLRSTLDRLPAQHPAAEADALLHVARAIVTREGKESLGVEMTSSNVVKRLLENGAAMRGGMQLADVVVAVNGIVLGERRVVDVLAKAMSPIVFTVIRVEEREESDSDADVVEHQHQHALQPPPMAAPPTMLLVEGEHYQIQNPQGSPPNFVGVAMRDKSKVAVRQADGRDIDACARAMREAKFWRVLSPRGTKPCASILAYYGQQLVSGSLYTVTEPILGTLAAAFRQNSKRQIPEIRSIATDLLCALAHMHGACRLVHCNIGLDTVAQCANGTWKLFGFSSVARTTGVRASCAHVIENSKFVPFVSLAPELADYSGEAPVGKEVDIWAAGLLIATLLNGVEPCFDSDHELTLPDGAGDTSANILRDTATLCLNPQPEKRPTAAELLSYLSNGTAGQSNDFTELRLNVHVKRDAKGLGIGVSRGNIVQSLTAGHVLQIEDEIVSVDGVDLAGRHLSQVLRPEALSYEFVCCRRDHVTGMTMRRLPPDHPVLRPKAKLRLLPATILRDSQGLGLGLNRANIIEQIVPGGAAERCCMLQLGDVVIAVDGVQIGAKGVNDVVKPDVMETSLTILRANPVEPIAVMLKPPARLKQVSKLRELGDAEGEAEAAEPPTPGPVAVAAAARASTRDIGTCTFPVVDNAPSQTLHAPYATNANEARGGGMPSDTQLLNFFLELQGFDRPMLMALYESSVQSAASQAAIKQSAILRSMGELARPDADINEDRLLLLSHDLVNLQSELDRFDPVRFSDTAGVYPEDAMPPPFKQPCLADVFSRARELLSTDLGVQYCGTYLPESDVRQATVEHLTESPSITDGPGVQAKPDVSHGMAAEPNGQASPDEDKTEPLAASDEDEPEPLALRIQRLLQQSREEACVKSEMTSTEMAEMAAKQPHGRSARGAGS